MNDLQIVIAFFTLFIPTALAVVAAYDAIERWWTQ
jgi:hypothetical protein